MSTKLQRSSVSFRRQGSSGHIWSDPLDANKGSSAVDAAPHLPEAPVAVPMPSSAPPIANLSASIAPPLATPPARRPQPRFRCGFFAVLCPCIRPSPSTTTTTTPIQ
uniref:Uncharacterized protein n=1 Tax=Ananas comosus var. bracteatus TaxID=296719 RepID=A0A6V7QBV7_ANACO|nr:unnamed protein product [Ananas comosus var. bracteatus]